jgi:anti-sigma B factor antagonist
VAQESAGDQGAFSAPGVEGRVSHVNGVTVVALSGELDAAAYDDVDVQIERIDAAAPDAFALDLRGLRFMDSSGVRIVIRQRERVANRGGRFAVVRGSELVDRLFNLVGLDGVIELVDDPSEL